MSGTPNSKDTLSIKEQILTEINNINPGFVDDDEAHTSEEWSEMLGFGLKKTQRIIKKLILNGKMISMTIPIKDIAGRRNYTYKYKLVNNE